MYQNVTKMVLGMLLFFVMYCVSPCRRQMFLPNRIRSLPIYLKIPGGIMGYPSNVILVTFAI